MTKLTLPIQIGRRYVRRDGVVVTARKFPLDSENSVVYVGPLDTPPSGSLDVVWRRSGSHSTHLISPLDLIADAPEEQAEAPAGHPQAERMAQYAEDARTHTEPWTLWEWSDDGVTWACASCHPGWDPNRQYRRKPRTILINGHEVPEPLRELPPPGSAVYWPDIADGEHVAKHALVGSMLDWPCLTRLRSRGLLHLTRDAAEQHARALLSFTMEGEA